MAKTIIVALILTVALALNGAQAVIRTIGWSYGDASGIVGFRVYWGATSGHYEHSQDVSYTSPVATNYTAKIAFPPGSFAVVVAVAKDGESGGSNEIQVQ